MNSQISFSNEEKKELLSTPKFHKNKSIYSLEKDETILDNIKQNINCLINIEKINNDIISNNNIEDINNEYKNLKEPKNYFMTSLLKKINGKNEINNCYNNQFSFDEKSDNYIFSKNERDNNKENIDNNIMVINNINKKKEFENRENCNNEIKYINDVDSYLINSNIKNNNENMENNFNYILPLESDKSSEHFKFISFQGFSEENQDNNIITEQKIPNQKKMTGEKKMHNNPEIINKKIRIGYLSKQRENPEKKMLKEDIKLTPQKNNNKEKYKVNNSDNFNHIIKKINNSKLNYNSSKKKRKFNIKIPNLIDENKNDKCLTEPNILFDLKNSQKNTFFTSNENNLNNSNMTPKNENILNKITQPFKIEKINNNIINNNDDDNKSKQNEIENNIIKEISLNFNKINHKRGNSIDFQRNNKFKESNKNLIYEKNYIGKENKSFSINKKENSNLIHSRNNSQLNTNNNFTYDHSRIKKKIKNSVFLLQQINKNNYNCQTRNNSYRHHSISISDSSTQKTIKIIKEEKKEICSPFCKSKIINKNSKYIFINQSSSIENRNKTININNEQYEDDNTFISSNKYKNNDKFTIFCNYDSKLNKKNSSKEVDNDYGINKIKVNIAHKNNIRNNKVYQNTSFMNYKINKPHYLIEKKRGNITERYKDSFTEKYKDSITYKDSTTERYRDSITYKDSTTERHKESIEFKDSNIGPANIYTKKFIFSNNNNSNTNIYSKKNKEKINSYKIKKDKETKILNKSTIIEKEIKFPKKEFCNNNNNVLKKDKNKFREYFKDILSNINLNKNIRNKKQKINYLKNIKTKNRNDLINSNICSQTEKEISNINSFKPKIKYKKNNSNNSDKINKQYNTINNSTILGYHYKFRENPKISTKKSKLSFSRENSLNIPNFRKNIVKYSILRNNQNNEIRNELSIYIGYKNINNDEQNFEKPNIELTKKKKGKYSIDNNKLKAINVNKKTIINVNQFYPSYFINNNSNIFKNKNNMTSFV